MTEPTGARAWTESEVLGLVAAFETCTLPVAQWRHDAHVLVALWYVRRFELAQAQAAMRSGLQRYLAAVGGQATAYSETVTCAWIAIIDRFAREHRGLDLAELAAAALAELCQPRYLERHYSPERLASPQARIQWLSPDREPIAASPAWRAGRARPLVIRDAQLSTFATPDDDAFFRALLAWVRDAWWEQTQGYTDAILEGWLRAVAARALRSGIRREPDVQAFVDLELRCGPEFERKLSFAPAILGDGTLPGGAKIALLRQRALGRSHDAT